MVKVDPGYPDDAKFLATVNDGFFKVMDRRTRALKPGARDFLSPSRIERVGDKLIKVHLQWGANDTFPSQLPIAAGDVVTICNGSAHAIVVDNSLATTFYGLKLLASPGMGILENGGAGGMVLQNVSIVPGPRPAGATTDRLISTNSDGSHFITVERGPTIQDCTYANTSDDAVNVHGFYYYVVQKTAPRKYILTPKWDIGLMAGDSIETCESGTFRSLGRTKIVQLTKRKAPELKVKIAQIWKNKSPTTQPDLVYDIELQQDLPLKVADAVTSLTRIGSGTAIRRCSFHACGRVLVKSPDSIVEGCQFTYSSGNALQAGSDIGFWSEAGFADNLTLKNNHFDHSITGANELTAGNAALGTIYIGMVPPAGAKGFANNFQNRNVTIEGNRIDNSFIYGIFVGNADGVKIIDNVVGQTFIRGSFDAGKFYGATPDSGIFIGGSKNAEITNNKVARGRVAKLAVAVDRTCVKDSIRLANNVLA
jgi:parallel beta-helix repeat protein